MNKFSLFINGLLMLFALVANATPLTPALTPDKVPLSLHPWVDWVLHNHPQRHCPLADATTPHANQRQCVWTTQLKLTITDAQAHFVQQVQLYQPGWVVLPGSAEQFPQQVTLDDRPLIVTERQGIPIVQLATGIYTLQGQFNWEQRPEYLRIPPHTGLVALTVDNQVIPIPNLDTSGRLWLRQGHLQSDPQAAQNRLDLKVYRQVTDDIPLQVMTRLELDVAGRHREIVLGPVLLPEQIPMNLESAVPARLESDGRLRVQVRPGSWLINIHSRQMGHVTELKLPEATEAWVSDEIWVFNARNALRLVEITGVVGIDPQQTALPNEWRRYPAYQINPGQTFTILERRRGDPEPPPEQLSLQRNFWLDFDGQGYSVQDRINGTMTHSWRLEMGAPPLRNLVTELGRVSVNGENQFITRLEDSPHTGVEVRHGNINLVADSRLEQAVTDLPAVSWNRDFQSVSAVLHFPPGWELLHAAGVDDVPGTWFQKWTLLDLFIVLIIATAIGKLWRWYWGGLALITLALTYHEPGAPQLIWLNVLAALALVRVLPATGVFVWLVRWYRNLSLIGLIVVVLPFLLLHTQKSVYPQLAYGWHDLAQPMSAQPDINRGFAATAHLTETEEAFTMQAAPMTPLPDSSLARPESRANIKPSQNKFYPRKKLAQIDPNARVQTGPGLPQWEWYNSVNLNWHGPVQRQQTVHLLLLSPEQRQWLGIVQVLLLASLTVFLLWQAWQTQAKSIVTTARQQTASMAGLGLGMILSLGLLSYTPDAYAAESATPIPLSELGTATTSQPSPFLVVTDFPDTALLNELERRLLAPPTCVPHCVSSPQMHVDLTANSLSIRQVIHSYTDTTIPLPGTVAQWLPQQIWLNETPPTALERRGGVLWLPIPAGIHQVHMQGVLPNRNAVLLPLPLLPHHVTVTQTDWQVEGLRENGRAEQQLQFTRSQAQGEEQLADLEMGSLPPFVQISRTLSLGVDWQVETQVTRLTPAGTAIVLEIPLLPGESVTSEQVRVENGNALLNLSPYEPSVSWVSLFDEQPTLTLTAPDSINSAEIWKLNASAIWHVDVEGIPVIHHQDGQGNWLPQWRPLPGESVTLQVSRPAGIAGQVMTIDRSHLSVSPGKRATDSRLNLTIRSSRGGQHVLKLPTDAELQKVTINGRSQPIRQEGNQVTLPIVPGMQHISLEFRQNTGIAATFHTPQVDLGMASVNSLIELSLPQDRWVLFTGGTPIGPAVKIWSLLAVMVLLAVILGRVRITPLNTVHWLLLAVVLSQVHVGAALIVVAWLLALGWRGRWTAEVQPLAFNFVQLSLGVLTIAALSVLLVAIQQGLLGSPDMQVAGNASNAHLLRWYQDRISDQLPSVWVYTLPMLGYRIAMLLWALWLAFALVRWLQWGWGCYIKHGLWREVTFHRPLASSPPQPAAVAKDKPEQPSQS